MRQEKKIVKEFYENYGWTRTDNGVYKDTAAFVDTRPVMQAYHQRSMSRLADYFEKGGRLFLDAGCGAQVSDDYMSIGSRFQQRVCVDISSNALREAREKLGEKTWYVVADITALPFRDAHFAGILCAHVLYHLSPDEQAPAINELHRIQQRGGVCVIVYTWATCLMTNIALYLNPRMLLPKIPGMRWLWRTFLKPYAKTASNAPVPAPDAPSLYFHPQDYHWYRTTVANRMSVTLGCWQAVSLPFSQAFVLDKTFTPFLLTLISGLEQMFPAFMGRVGAYPLFILRK